MSQVDTNGTTENAIAQRSDRLHLLARDDSANAMLLDRPKYEQVWKVATMFASSDLVPEHFRGKEANCFIACQLAFRFRMDPFMVMQNCYVVHGRPGFEGKFIIALLNASGLFEDPLDFDFDGERQSDGWVVRVSAKRARTGKLCELLFRYSTAVAEGWAQKNPKWRSMPEQMMMYRGAAFFSRVFCPEVIMGMQTAEEIQDGNLEPDPVVVPSFRSAIDSLTAPKPVEKPVQIPVQLDKGGNAASKEFDPDEIAREMDRNN